MVAYYTNITLLTEWIEGHLAYEVLYDFLSMTAVMIFPMTTVMDFFFITAVMDFFS